jgi:hypothetical protein
MPPQWLKLAEAAALIPSGARVAVGGSMSMALMALIRGWKMSFIFPYYCLAPGF